MLTDVSQVASDFKIMEGIENPIFFLALFDREINDGVSTLYPWQIEIGERLGAVRPTGLKPFKFVLCAANGSGKDKFIIAPFAVWFICCKRQARVIITSSSSSQMKNQTEKYIVNLAQAVNKWSEANLGEAVLKIRQRHITCAMSGSEIVMFVTDEGERAEGYHPLTGGGIQDNVPHGEMAIIVNEAKSVSKEIYGALRRCTGYNYWLDVSSPGEPNGDFHDHWESWPNRKRVTYFDCLRHQSADEFENDKRELGEHDPLFRSKWLALFTTVGGNQVIEQLKIESLLKKLKNNEVKHIQKGVISIGIDVALSTNGDETVISCFNGNRQSHLICMRNKDAELLAGNIEYELLETVKVKKEQPLNIDDGNVGRAVADILRRRGWTNIRRVLNQSAAKNKRQFRNRGAEIWHKLKRLVENHLLILINDEKLIKQISSRKYKMTDGGLDKLTLESKQSMMSQGLPSPDRADATALAVKDFELEELLDNVALDETKEITSKLKGNTLTPEQIEDLLESRDIRRSLNKGKPRLSLNAMRPRKMLMYEN